MKKLITTFEGFKNIPIEDVFDEFYKENPLHKTHDFYAFIYNTDFVKIKNSENYKKTIYIEKMHRITNKNFRDIELMKLRARINNKEVGTIWWPKDARDLIDNKSSKEMDDYLIDLIIKHKSDDSDPKGKKIFDKVYKRLKHKDDAITNAKNFNI